MKKLLILLYVVIGLSSVAQQRRDPRPLTGLKKESLPPLITRDELVRRAVPGGVLRGARYVGKAEKIAVATGQASTIQLEKGSTTTSERSLWKVLRSSNGTVNWMWRIGASATREQPQVVKPVQHYLDDVKALLRIEDPKSEFIVERDEQENGMRHVRMRQVYKNVPVWKRDINVHIDKSGEPSIINGTYEPTPVGAEITAVVTPQQSIDITTKDLSLTGHLAVNDSESMKALGIPQPKAELVLYPEKGQMRLAYDVMMHPNLLEHYSYIVDARSGEIVRRIPLHCSLVPASNGSMPLGIMGITLHQEHSSKSFMPLAGFSASTGTDLNNVSRNFRSYQHTDNQYYMAWDLPSYNSGASQPPNDLTGGGLTLDLRNTDATNTAQIFHVTSPNNSWNDKASVSAHANMNVCYDYYRTTHSRNAIDGKNSTIISIVHVTENGQGMDNAYWNGKLMLYGDGNAAFKPLAASLDVAGHEMTHGVTGNSADLIYEFQPGALNESFSDVFGIFIDDDDFTVGEGLILGSKLHLRNLENPADPNSLAVQPTHMNEFQNLGSDQDNGGVHINSGIPNRAAVLLIKAIGRNDARKIYYLALTKYLTRNSQFIDCRIACESAANELFGNGSSQTQAVSNAFASVGIGGSSPGDNQDDVPSQTGGRDYVTFIWGNDKIGYLEPDDPQLQAFEFSHAAAVARVSNTNNGPDRCQITTPRTGSSIWFVTPGGRLAYIESQTGNVFDFPNLNIQQAGDIWNASVSPDEEYVSLVSSYVNDPNIYIFDGAQIGRIELLPETPDGGAQQTIQYPDVMSWSPNKWENRIAFDAYNEDSFGSGGLISYWSMYEINFGTGKIYSLIPAQPEDINIGNVTYSKTDPDLIAFNVYDQAGSDIWIGNFETGDIFPLGIPNVSINSQPLDDAERPSFAPNDAFLCFTSVENNALCYFNAANSQVQPFTYPSPLYNPNWFLLGGSAGVKGIKEHFFSQPSVFPSITRDQTIVGFTIKEEANCRIELVNVLGVATRKYTGKLAAGAQTIAINVNDLAAGAYLVRLTDGKHEAFTKLVIE